MIPLYYRSSHWSCSVNYQNSQENTCGKAFFDKVAGLRPATLLKKTLWHQACNFKKRLWRRCFPVNFAKFVRAPILQNSYDECL